MRFKNTLLGNTIKDYLQGFLMLSLFSPLLILSAFALSLLAAGLCWAAIAGWNLISPF